MKISEILREAIAYLWHPSLGLPSYRCDGASCYSCGAIRFAIDDICRDKYLIERIAKHNQILTGLSRMGLNPEATWEFREFTDKAERQLARALWLEWAALMAEEQGL